MRRRSRCKAFAHLQPQTSCRLLLGSLTSCPCVCLPLQPQQPPVVAAAPTVVPPPPRVEFVPVPVFTPGPPVETIRYVPVSAWLACGSLDNLLGQRGILPGFVTTEDPDSIGAC